MTEKVNLYQDQRLDIQDANALQGLVYEYVQRALRGVLGKGNGLLGSGLSVDAEKFKDSRAVTVSGKEFVQRSGDYFLDDTNAGVPVVTSASASAAGKGKGSAQVFLIDTDSVDIGQSSTISFVKVYSDSGSDAAWVATATQYSVYARIVNIDSETEGRVHWDTASSSESQQNVSTRRKEFATFEVDKTANNSTREADGYVRIYDVTSVDSNADSATYTTPTLTPHMAYDLQAEGFSSVNTGNSIRKALESATAGSLSVSAANVGGLYELVAQIVQQLGWLYDPTQNIPDTTFQKPEVGIKSIEDFHVQNGASYKMPGMLFSGVLHSDRFKKQWKFGSPGNLNFNAHFEDKTGATSTSQGVFLGHFDASVYGGTGIGNVISLDSASTGPWPDKNGPSYRPLTSLVTAGHADSSDYAQIYPTNLGTLAGGGAGWECGNYFDLKLTYDATKFKITAVHATPYADVGIHNPAGVQQTGSTGQHLATSNFAYAPVVLVHQNAIYIRSVPGTVLSTGNATLGSTGGHASLWGPRSLCLTIFGYCDDGGGTSGWGSSSVQDLLDGDGPTVAGGTGTEGT